MCFHLVFCSSIACIYGYLGKLSKSQDRASFSRSLGPLKAQHNLALSLWLRRKNRLRGARRELACYLFGESALVICQVLIQRQSCLLDSIVMIQCFQGSYPRTILQGHCSASFALSFAIFSSLPLAVRLFVSLFHHQASPPYYRRFIALWIYIGARPLRRDQRSPSSTKT